MDYNPRVIKQVSQSRSILRELWEVTNGHGEIYLFNVYKGVPVQSQASILRIREPGLTASLTRRQAVCLRVQGLTYLHCPPREQFIRANVAAVDLATQVALLDNFTYADPAIGKRESVRVDIEPGEVINVAIYARKYTGVLELPALSSKPGGSGYLPTQTVSNLGGMRKPRGAYKLVGRLTDLALSGLGMEVLAPTSLIAEDFQRNSDISVILSLPSGIPGRVVRQPVEEEVKLPGRIRYLEQGVQQKYRLGVHIFPDAETRQRIEAYIALRQEQILQELEMQEDLYQ